MIKAIKAEGLSKAYQIGQIGTGTLSRDLERWYARIQGKEDPFLKIGEINDQNIKSSSNIAWSLKDINFEIQQGEAVGIIGRNGAGKSTLLKILSKITSPTTGRITGKGRVASLLEVGTGFHPELSGRENIFLNGAILGMRKKEIQKKLEEIVDFAGVDRYIDTPVKRYSSGMYVRLAFAVAAHLESEILIIDEVLAVGDAEFQKKCLGKMGDLSKGEGRTVLFVSHNMNSIRQLCDTGIILNSGQVQHIGSSDDCVNYYHNFEQATLQSGYWLNPNINVNKFQLIKITTKDRKGNIRDEFTSNEIIFIEFDCRCPYDYKNLKIGFDLSKNQEIAFRSQQVDNGISDVFEANFNYKITCQIEANILNLGKYSIIPLVSIHNEISLIDFYEPVLEFNISLENQKSKFISNLNISNNPGAVYPILPWRKEQC